MTRFLSGVTNTHSITNQSIDRFMLFQTQVLKKKKHSIGLKCELVFCCVFVLVMVEVCVLHLRESTPAALRAAELEWLTHNLRLSYKRALLRRAFIKAVPRGPRLSSTATPAERFISWSASWRERARAERRSHPGVSQCLNAHLCCSPWPGFSSLCISVLMLRCVQGRLPRLWFWFWFWFGPFLFGVGLFSLCVFYLVAASVQRQAGWLLTKHSGVEVCVCVCVCVCVWDRPASRPL